MNTFLLRTILIPLFFCAVNFTVFCQGKTLSSNLNQAIKNGETDKVNELCSEIIFSSEDPADGARANTIISIILFLDVDPSAASRAESIGDFFVSSENEDEQNAADILSFLAGNSSDKKLSEQMKDKDPDWQATAAVARYVKNLNDHGLDPAKLNICVKMYMAISEKLQAESWGNVWKGRLIKWHNSLQDSQDDGQDLEALIIKIKEDILTGPIKEQIATIGNILDQLLRNKKVEASESIKKAFAEMGAGENTPDNKEYTPLLDYLSGKNKSIKIVYKATQPNQELFLMTTLAVFTKELSLAKAGEIQKATLLSHLKNFSMNAENSKQKLVLDWKPRVQGWKQWCSEDFPLSGTLKPLLVLHSKAFAEKSREKLALASALKLYEKMKRYKRFKQISMKDFKKVRELFQNRPHSPSMNFSLPEFKTYMNTLPAEVQRGEWMRLRYMQTFKENMIKNLNFSQYSGNIKLQNKTFKGQVIKADKNYIEIGAGSSRRKRSGKKYKWSDLKPEQFITFTESYIKNNIGGKVRGRSNVFSSRDATEKILCKEYRLLSLFCDWYGQYQDAVTYGKKANSYSYDKGATRQLLLN